LRPRFHRCRFVFIERQNAQNSNLSLQRARNLIAVTTGWPPALDEHRSDEPNSGLLTLRDGQKSRVDAALPQANDENRIESTQYRDVAEILASVERHHQTARAFGNDRAVETRDRVDEFGGVDLGFTRVKCRGPRIGCLFESCQLERTNACGVARARRVTGNSRCQTRLHELHNRRREPRILERERKRGGNARLADVVFGSGYEVAAHTRPSKDCLWVNGSQRRDVAEIMSVAAVRVDTPVIIVGGGPVGLSLALGLARYGTRSIVLERSATPAEQSRAAVIWPRTQEILRDWGAYDALRAAGRFARVLRAINARTQGPLLTVDFSCIDDVFDDAGALLIPQNDTERILRGLVNAHAMCELRTEVTVTGLRQDRHAVDVFFDGQNGTQRARAAFVVGCDGAQGVVRHALGLTLVGTTYDSRIVLSDETIPDGINIDGDARARVDLPGMRLAIRFSERTWRLVASVPKSSTDEEALSPNAHRERIREVFGEVETRTEWTGLFKVHRRHAQRFLVGRVAIAGDAAHLNSPAGAQGMNSGIQDAANLAWKLALALRNDGCAGALLDSYDAERRQMVTDTVERFTDRLTRMGIGFSSRARQFVVRAFSRAVRGSGMQRKICRGVGMLSGRYASSPIVDARHPLAGRRVDDLRLRDGARLNARRGGEAILVVAGDLTLDLPHLQVAVPPKRWHVKPPVVLVVRPDGCVGAVVEKPTHERIEAAWRRAFCDAIPLP
jgi:2-polyprenyl-6-methoxyphenol hydroxylase-like FAD-dependent oxidoreductase